MVLWSNLGRAKEEGVKGEVKGIKAVKGVAGVGRKRWHC